MEEMKKEIPKPKSHSQTQHILKILFFQDIFAKYFRTFCWVVSFFAHSCTFLLDGYFILYTI